MKLFVVILIGITILAGTNSAAMSQETFNSKNMTCNITTPDTDGCTGLPTLHSGVLTISKDGTFKLKAQYNGCFIIENVMRSGKFQVSYFRETMSFELLSKRVTGIKGNIPDLPRTLGFANLNYDRLDGYLIDLSAVMRERGRNTENIITAKLQCEVIE